MQTRDGVVAYPSHSGLALQAHTQAAAHTVVAGDPLWQATPATSEISDASLPAALACARGQFCLAHIDDAQRALHLATDALAIRPLYYGQDHGVLYFATSLRALRALCPELGRVADLTGQIERVALGFTLGRRTPYAQIRVLAPGEHLRCAVVPTSPKGSIGTTGTTNPHIQTHALLDSATPLPAGAIDEATLDTLSEALHARFVEAVRLRAAGLLRVAYLSGGLDSRCVSAALVEPGFIVHTLNYAPAGSADQVLGAQAARALGTEHHEYPDGANSFWQRSVDAVTQWRAQHPALAHAPHVATGFGGECLLAPTNITATLLAQWRAQPHCASSDANSETDAAIDHYLTEFGHSFAPRALRGVFAPHCVEHGHHVLR